MRLCHWIGLPQNPGIEPWNFRMVIGRFTPAPSGDCLFGELKQDGTSDIVRPTSRQFTRLRTPSFHHISSLQET